MSDNVTTYTRFRPPSSLCTTQIQAHILTGILLQLVRGHFSAATNIECPHLRGCLWVPQDNDPVAADPARSTIWIEPVYKWDPKQTQLRPAVVLRRNDLQPRNKIGIGMNQLYTLGGLDPDKLPESGEEYFLPFNGSHTLFCVATDGGIAELLSTEVARLFYQFARVISDEFRFEYLELAHVGAVVKLKESFEHFAVPVTINYTYNDQWVVTKQAPRFAGVSLQTAVAD